MQFGTKYNFLSHSAPQHLYFWGWYTQTHKINMADVLRQHSSESSLPVDPLDHYEDLLPGAVCSGLAVDDGVSEKLLQALHIWNTARHVSLSQTTDFNRGHCVIHHKSGLRQPPTYACQVALEKNKVTFIKLRVLNIQFEFSINLEGHWLLNTIFLSKLAVKGDQFKLMWINNQMGLTFLAEYWYACRCLGGSSDQWKQMPST